MELNNINVLIDKYFEGNTTLAEEQKLKAYFASGNIAEAHKPHQHLFFSINLLKNDTFSKPIKYKKETNIKRFWKWSVAAIVLVCISASGFYINQQNKLTKAQQEALLAYENARKTMYLLSENINKGQQKLNYLQHFEDGVTQLQIINQFNDTKNKILK